MENRLDKIVLTKQQEVLQLKRNSSFQTFEKSPFFEQKTRSLSESIQQKGFGIIAEIKRKSPSAGFILPDLNPLQFAKIYEQAGMAGMSILTDASYFGGSNEDVIAVRKESNIPILRKEFIIDEIQIFESKAIGADAILLIAEILTKQQVKEFTIIAKSLGLEVIMEIYSYDQLEKIHPEIDILGINNRNLKNQQTSIENSIKMASYLPSDKIKISESGIKNKADIEQLAQLNYQGALIGESILKQEDPSVFLGQINSVLL